MPRPYLLVVDDDPSIAHMVARGLRSLSLPVHLAVGPLTAWRIVKREGGSPRVLITDVHLGAFDGRVLAGELGRVFPRLPVLLMSGGFTPGCEPSLPSISRQQFLAKPFSGDDLLKAVRMLLAPADV